MITIQATIPLVGVTYRVWPHGRQMGAAVDRQAPHFVPLALPVHLAQAASSLVLLANELVDLLGSLA